MISDIFTDSDTMTMSGKGGKSIFIADVNDGSIVEKDLEKEGLMSSLLPGWSVA
jgi:hypothetical protein